MVILTYPNSFLFVEIFVVLSRQLYQYPTGSIIFTREEEEDNSLPFLDAKFTRKEDGSVMSTVWELRG